MEEVIFNILCVSTFIVYTGILCSIFLGICIGAFTYDKRNNQQGNQKRPAIIEGMSSCI